MVAEEPIRFRQDLVEIEPHSLGDLLFATGQRGQNLPFRFGSPERLDIDEDSSLAPALGDDSGGSRVPEAFENRCRVLLEIGNRDDGR